jgi:chromate transporter
VALALEKAVVVKDLDDLIALAGLFAVLSMLAFGGANPIIPEIHRQAVDIAHWMTNEEFSSLFAIAQATPGPNILFVTLVGYHVAGFVGALVSTAALCAPCCTVTFLVTRVWDRFKKRPWRAAVQLGLTSVTVGIVASSALIIATAAGKNLPAVAITAVTAVFAYFTRLNPILALGVGGLLGGLGLV